MWKRTDKWRPRSGTGSNPIAVHKDVSPNSAEWKESTSELAAKALIKAPKSNLIPSTDTGDWAISHVHSSESNDLGLVKVGFESHEARDRRSVWSRRVRLCSRKRKGSGGDHTPLPAALDRRRNRSLLLIRDHNGQAPAAPFFRPFPRRRYSVDVVGSTSAASRRTSAIDRRFPLPAMRAVKIALLLVAFFLCVPHVALAQESDQNAIGQDHPDVASTPSRNDPLEQAPKINAEIVKLFNAGRYADAIPLAQRELAIYEKALGPDHPDVLTSLNTLAFFYEKQGRYADAEPLYQRAAAIREKEFGPDDPVVGSLLNTLAGIYNNQKRYGDAEPLQKRALAISEKAYGPDDPSVAFPLDSLATTYSNQGRYADAELLYKRALAIREKAFGPDDPFVAISLNSLGLLYDHRERDQKPGRRILNHRPARPLCLLRHCRKFPRFVEGVPGHRALLGALLAYADAEPLLQRALAIREKAFGPNDPYVAISLNNLGLFYDHRGRYADAEPLLKRALAICDKVLDPDHPDIAVSLNNLATLYSRQGRYADAEPLFKRALALREKALGPDDNPEIAFLLNNLGTNYNEQGRYEDAWPLLKRSLEMREKLLGPDHPDVFASLNALAFLSESQSLHAEAEWLSKRSLAISEKALGPDHPDVAVSLNNLATLYSRQGRYADAEPLFKRALAINERALGPDHPYVAATLNSLAELYRMQGRYSDALPIVQRTISQNTASEFVAFAVLYSSQFAKLIAPMQALDASYTVLQHSTTSAAGEAISNLRLALRQVLTNSHSLCAKIRICPPRRSAWTRLSLLPSRRRPPNAIWRQKTKYESTSKK